MVVCETFPSLYSQTQKYTPQGHSETRIKRGKKKKEVLYFLLPQDNAESDISPCFYFLWKFYLLVTQAPSP